MSAISRANYCLSGSHAGVSIGEDGPSQMALEDIAALRAVHGSAVLHPSDANQVTPLVVEMAERPGISYLRTLRGKTVVRTDPAEPIRIGGSRTARAGENDRVTVVACGVTVDEAANAAEQLASEGIDVRVLDCSSINPIHLDPLPNPPPPPPPILTLHHHSP